MAVKITPFNTSIKQTLNGIDTCSFKHVCNATGAATRFKENATVNLSLSGNLAFAGTVKKCESERSGRIKSITAESPLAVLRDTDLQETDARELSSVSSLLDSIMPDNITIKYNLTKNPLLQYAFRSGSIITHLNTICSLAKLNWRSSTVTATTCEIVISEDGETPKDAIELVENKDIFKLKLDKSLYKKYTHITAIGVEQEVSGYCCTASIQFEGMPYFFLDCDDGEVYEDEILPDGDTYEYMTPLKLYRRFDLEYGWQLKGWDGQNTVFKVNNEFMSFGYKAGSSLMNIERGYWNSVVSEAHVKSETCALVNQLLLQPSTFTIPSTTFFKIGSEIVRGTMSASSIELATINATTGTYEGRGQEYFVSSNPLIPSGWRHNPKEMYSHKQGSVVVPYYPDLDPASAGPSLAVTIHGKGVTTKDGIDKLAWGTLLNIQNGILSGSCLFKAADFYDSGVAVGNRIRITTASSMTGPNSVIEPATTYDVLIYSITKNQNSLIEIEFGNVIPEVLQMLKSGEYALQAAVRKSAPLAKEQITDLSVSGRMGKTSNDKLVRLVW